MLRIAQLFASLDLPTSHMSEHILDEALIETSTFPTPLRGANEFTVLAATLGNETVDLPPAKWVPLLTRYRALITGDEVPPDMLEVLQPADLED